ncbi:MAG TPA: hypothetical protein VIM02_06965 [Rhizomicrobium sp.]|jgi:hypothetical protein
MRLAFAGAAIAAMLAAPCLADDASDMAKVVGGFYQVHQASSQDGIPDATQRAKYEPYISPELDKLLAEGNAAESRYAAANKDSPPVVEGDLFSPNFEGVTRFAIGACATDATGGHCAAMLTYDDGKHGAKDKPLDWTDTVKLAKTPSGWRVDDIAYGGSWDFGNHGTLKAILQDAISNAGD